MELDIIAIATKFWQWSLLIVLVIVGYVINLLDKKKSDLKFSYDRTTKLKTTSYQNKRKRFLERYSYVVTSTRNWEITKDWKYNINGKNYVIPAGFQFDGASIPKFLRTFFSPVGVLLMGGLVHDYMYKYTACKPARPNKALLIVDQKRADQIFRDINIEVNGFYFMNYLAYWSLRIGGFVAWNGHRKRNAKIK